MEHRFRLYHCVFVRVQTHGGRCKYSSCAVISGNFANPPLLERYMVHPVVCLLTVGLLERPYSDSGRLKASPYVYSKYATHAVRLFAVCARRTSARVRRAICRAVLSSNVAPITLPHVVTRNASTNINLPICVLSSNVRMMMIISSYCRGCETKAGSASTWRVSPSQARCPWSITVDHT